MKRINQLVFTMLILLGTCMGLQAQSSAIDRYYEAYQQDERFSKVSISGKMFGLFTNFELDNPEDQALVKAIAKLEGLKMLVYESKKGSDAKVKSLFAEALKKPQAGMEELMSISKPETEIRFFITEQANGKVSELLMLLFEDQHVLVLMSLVGDIDLKEIAALSKKMDIEGFEHLEKIEKR